MVTCKRALGACIKGRIIKQSTLLWFFARFDDLCFLSEHYSTFHVVIPNKGVYNWRFIDSLPILIVKGAKMGT